MAAPSRGAAQLAEGSEATRPLDAGAFVPRLAKTGFAKVALPGECARLVRDAWSECSGFLTWWLLRHPEPVRLIRDLPPLVRGDALPAVQLGSDDELQRRLHCLVLGDFGPGDRRSKSAIASAYTGESAWMGPGMSAKIAASSGLGTGTSYFGGSAHIKLQCCVAKLVLQPLYANSGTGSMPPDLVNIVEKAAEKAIEEVGLQNFGKIWVQCLEKKKPKHTKPRLGVEKVVEDFVEAFRMAAAQRDGRIQAQLPHRSVLYLTDSVGNEKLLNMMHHPTAGVEGLRMAKDDFTMEKGPFRIPVCRSKTETVSPEACVKTMNTLCNAVHEIYRGVKDSQSKDGQMQGNAKSRLGITGSTNLTAVQAQNYVDPSALKGWVTQLFYLLEQREEELGLHHSTFVPTKLVLPAANGEELLVWTSYHCTADCYIPAPLSTSMADARTLPVRDDLLKNTLFFDAMPRSLFSEAVWSVLWACHSSSIVDVGAGSKRGSQWGYHYEKDNLLRTEIGAEWQQYLGAPIPGNCGSNDGKDVTASVVVIPERFRVKICSKWGNLHIDHAPLPNNLQLALDTFDMDAADHKKKKHKNENSSLH